jgi:hypothetical protein
VWTNTAVKSRRVHCDWNSRIIIHGKWPTRRTILYYVFIFIFNFLHATSTSCSSSGETNCVNTTSGNCHSMSVAVSLNSYLHTTGPPTQSELPEVVLTQFVSPNDEHDVLETCRVKNKNKYAVKNCASRWSFSKNHNMMHGQQNVKFHSLFLLWFRNFCFKCQVFWQGPFYIEFILLAFLGSSSNPVSWLFTWSCVSESVFIPSEDVFINNSFYFGLFLMCHHISALLLNLGGSIQLRIFSLAGSTPVLSVRFILRF